MHAVNYSVVERENKGDLTDWRPRIYASHLPLGEVQGGNGGFLQRGSGVCNLSVPAGVVLRFLSQ